jgi:transcriptional regulator with XRE-family HTH domain
MLGIASNTLSEKLNRDAALSIDQIKVAAKFLEVDTEELLGDTEKNIVNEPFDNYGEINDFDQLRRIADRLQKKVMKLEINNEALTREVDFYRNIIQEKVSGANISQTGQSG